MRPSSSSTPPVEVVYWSYPPKGDQVDSCASHRLAISVLALIGLLGSGCDTTDTGVGPVGPQGDIGPGEISEELADITGSGAVVSEDRGVSGFETVVLAGEGSLIVARGDFGMTVETDENLLEYIETDTVGSELRITTRAGVDIGPTVPPVYRVTLPALTGVELAGAGSIQTGAWEADTFTVGLSGVGDVAIELLTATTLNLNAQGVGAITVVGAVERQIIDIGGLAEYFGADLASTSAEIVCGGSGTAVLWVTGALDAEIAGTGSVSYYGDATATQQLSDAGTLTALGDR